MNTFVKRMQVMASIRIIKNVSALLLSGLLIQLATDSTYLLSLAQAALILKIYSILVDIKRVTEIKDLLNGPNVHIVSSKKELEKTLKDLE